MTSPNDILTSLTTKINSILGSNWKELDYVYDLEKNKFRDKDKRFGVGTRDGNRVDGTTKALTIDFNFFVTLANCFVNRSGDGKQRTALAEIYEQFEEINKQIFLKKLNNVDILLVSDVSYESPEVIDDQTISVTCNFIIKYRNQIT